MEESKTEYKKDKGRTISGIEDDKKLLKMASNLGLKRSETKRMVKKVTKLMLENEKKRDKEERQKILINDGSN